MIAHPPVPVGALPACDALGCRFELRPARAAETCSAFVHLPPSGAPAEYRIPWAWVDDSTKDIWAELQRWALRLHEGGADVAPR